LQSVENGSTITLWTAILLLETWINSINREKQKLHQKMRKTPRPLQTRTRKRKLEVETRRTRRKVVTRRKRRRKVIKRKRKERQKLYHLLH